MSEEETTEDETKLLKKLMKLRKTKKIVYKGIYRKNDIQIIE